MKKYSVLVLFLSIMMIGNVNFSYADQNSLGPEDYNEDRPGRIIHTEPDHSIFMPGSTTEDPSDIGNRPHTNHLLYLKQGSVTPQTAPSGYSPSDIWAAYGLSPSTVYSGGPGVIALVDAYDYPTAANDLSVFSTQFGLPACTVANGCFEKIYASGRKPRANCGWSQEMALDIEWAHAMAPNAKIVLVEAASNSYNDLFNAITVASNISSVNQISNSWGGSEFPSEVNYDSYFQTSPGISRNGIVYFAAAGDTGGQTIYPSASPYVIAAGGTSLKQITPSVIETAWSDSGGGPSLYETLPSYQTNVSNLIGNTQRGVPDFSAVADPETGVAVYDSTSCEGMSGWMVFGGTSVATPVLAGIVNLANSIPSPPYNTVAELSKIYSNSNAYTNSIVDPYFRDITVGSAGPYDALLGWDFVTGVGSNIGLSGK